MAWALPAIVLDALGSSSYEDLRNWTKSGTVTISAGVASVPNGGNAGSAGNPQWSDVSFLCRFTWATGAKPAPLIRLGGFTQHYRALFDGVNMSIQLVNPGGTTLATRAQSLVNGTSYWSLFTAVGTTLTLSIYADASGYQGAKIGTTLSVTDSTLSKGSIGLGNPAASAPATFGGLFPGVCRVSGPYRSGWINSKVQ